MDHEKRKSPPMEIGGPLRTSSDARVTRRRSPTRTRVAAARRAVTMMHVMMVVRADDRHGSQHKRGLGLAEERSLL
ncbi:hypothetical protein [Gemmatirosa kalamazoonensis]|uniref:hypothetical protein n=1 Tax=Gemmatirosa kalamazoonensis TaxID=861299 RepID=UPI0011DCB04F|nr:hypothetical protein [Gemmatirosa kalamazoonensis]